MPEKIIGRLMSEFCADLINNDPQVVSVISDMNADSFGLDVYDLHDASFNEARTEIDFEATIMLAGQAREAPFSGDALDVEVEGKAVKKSDGSWEIAHYSITELTPNFPEDEPD